jgi:hypothetical protein
MMGDEDSYQQVVDTEFTWMIECERSLDDVIRDLGAAGVRVMPDQRHTVNRWLEMFEDDSPIPLASRLAMLRGMLRTSCPAP